MDPLLARALAYQKLLTIEYHIILGRKKRLTSVNIRFEPVHFHHLIGLHKLKDLYVARQNRERVFRNILCGKMDYDHISSSKYFPEIQRRFDAFLDFESILDQNELIFRYHASAHQFSVIEADYLLSTSYRQQETYLFLAGQGGDAYVCRSFFPRERLDYTRGQTRYTMLYKEKNDRSTGSSLVQYDRLHR